VRSTSGEPLPGAILDVWQAGANSVYSGLMTEDFLPFDIPNDSTSVPKFNLRGRITADGDGGYEFRTIMPGVEHLGFKEEGSPVTALLKELDLVGVRPPHIHSVVSAEGFHTLITQAYFDGDPLVEGHLPPSAVKKTELHDDPADYQALGLSTPYRTLIYDFVLRPVTPPVPVRGGLKGFGPRP
jgi:catechol 1,2-dioxygenase